MTPDGAVSPFVRGNMPPDPPPPPPAPVVQLALELGELGPAALTASTHHV